ncbi:MAG: YajQ family cyclic di-GMP-binding protein, partial [Nevskia sp.]|nr:YajQ family cyclic di-GMP-binding protein [Nevskia sp.]
FDLKGTKTELEYDQAQATIDITAPDEFKIKSVIDILTQRLAKRSVSLKFFDFGKAEPAAGSTFRQQIKVRQGIDRDHGRQIVDLVKGAKLKVQAQIQDDQIRVVGKNKDDLQVVMQKLRKAELDIELQFVNYR